MKCPVCKSEFKPSKKSVAAELGSITSDLKKKTSAANGKLGGRPKLKTPKAKR